MAQGALGVGLVWFGGFRLFERIMGLCIAVMFVTVMVTAGRVGVDSGAVFAGLLTPCISDLDGQGLVWTVALMGVWGVP